MEVDGDDATPRRKQAQVARVKVVASRYAQAIQKSNLETRASTGRGGASSDRNGRPAVASSSSNAASIKVSASRGAAMRSASQTRTGVVSTVGARTPVPSTPAISTTSRGNTTGASSSDSNPSLSISEKLRLYRASKASQRPGTATATTRTTRSASASADPLRTAPRPTLPERITPPTEKAPSRPLSRGAMGSSTPIKRRIATPTGAKIRATPGTIHSSQPQKRSTATASVSASTVMSAARVPTSSTEEELELLECLYLQLCFTEAKAADTFRRQEQSAERQMIAAWNILQSKLQLLHDTSIRLDREIHIRAVEDHLHDQAEPFVQLASKISSFNDDLAVVSRSLEASLQRMPTPGIVCSPPELKRQLDGLSSTLETFLKQLQSQGMGSTVADALTFTQGMEESTDQICSLLLQVGHILEEIQLEVNTETSLKAHAIQEARVEKVMESKGWW